MPRWHVGIDIGGTFTDACAWNGRDYRRAKVPTTPDDFVRGVLTAIDALDLKEAFDLTAGSTIATNALLERRGARVAFIATDGFRDLPIIGRQNRPDLYALHVRKPAPLVDPDDCFTVVERLDPDGNVVTALDAAQSEAVLRSIRDRGIDTVAVCLLYSYLNPSHEDAVAEQAEALGLTPHCSSRILPEFREFERAATTIANAYVAPRTAAYFHRLADALRPRGAGNIRVMLSNGGQASTRYAARQPVRTILSGPAGGAIAAAHAARELGIARALTYDMGGTSTDVALCDGQVELTHDTVLDGWPIRVPMLAIHTIGAGGGSIASIDAAGALAVGPQSAGADPGPACYGRGDQPTITDAHCVLGRIRPRHFLGGRMPIDVARSEAAVGRIAAALRCDLPSAARAIIAVANASMELALKVVSAHQGHEPSDFWLVAFGGAAGLHACDLADALGLPGVIIPPDHGILSATGMLLADRIQDFSLTLPRPTADAPDLRMLQSAFGALMDEAADALFRDGHDLDEADCVRSIDLRYRGQSWELTVPVESLTDARRLLAPFHELHALRYGTSETSAPVETVTARVRTIVQVPKPRRSERPAVNDTPEPLERAEIWFDRPQSSAVFDRAALHAGQTLGGPALVVEPHATTVIPPGWTARVEPFGHLRIFRT
ncbi:MAG: hydantoinase/oxoprolinase family protein [Phycisphaerae bacterium]|nr:hydantoinase/oxoprolinase family protein [Phycisphaerae bacterium]